MFSYDFIVSVSKESQAYCIYRVFSSKINLKKFLLNLSPQRPLRSESTDLVTSNMQSLI
jgi:hypothetical protein